MKNKFSIGVDFCVFGRIFAVRHNKLRRAIPSEVYFKHPYKSGVFSVVICLVQWVVSQQRRDALLLFLNGIYTMRHNPKQCRADNKIVRVSTRSARNAVNDLFLRESSDSVFKAIKKLSDYFDFVEHSLNKKGV